MNLSLNQTEKLLEQAEAGSDSAVEDLLAGHRARLRAMVAVRLDRRIAARVDPSDIVQESFVEAVNRLPAYLHSRALPFYPWLRQLALDRMARHRRTHLQTAKRTVAREEQPAMELNDDSVVQLARRLVSRDASPSAHAMRNEIQTRARQALCALSDHDREILVMKYLEHLTLREIAAVLGLSEPAVKSRHIRALARYSREIGDMDQP